MASQDPDHVMKPADSTAGHEPEVEPPIDPRWCGAVKRDGSGRRCRLPAGHGTPHRTGPCKRHGGATRNHVARAQRLEAERAARVYGLPVRVDPRDALLEELWRAHGIVRWLAGEVAELDRGELFGPVGGGGDSYPRVEPHVLTRMLGEERDRLRAVAKTCHDVGIEERQQRLAEQMGGMLAVTIGAILDELGVRNDPRAPEVVRRHLAALEQGGEAIEGREAA